MLKGAIIGYGNVAARAHMPVWAKSRGARIVAAVEPSPEGREAFLKACPEGRCHAGVAELLDQGGLDFVDVCTPPASHLAIVRQSLAAGLHVMCEKPLTIRSADALAMADAAALAGRTVYAVHNWLKAPLCLAISELIGSGEIGQVKQVRWRTLRTRPAVAVGAPGEVNWRLDPETAGGGILFDHGWHAVYCVASWAGAPLKGLSARLETLKFHGLGVEDTAALEMDFGSAGASIYLTWAAEERANEIEIDGERGQIRVQGDCVILDVASGERRLVRPPALSEGSHHPDWFAGVAEDFVCAVARAEPGNLAEAVLCARVMDLATASSAAAAAWLELDAPAAEAGAPQARTA